MRYKRKAKVAEHITIIADDREKQSWSWLSHDWPVETGRLKVGDYSIKGYEDKITFEKKSGLSELLNNLTGSNRARFERFLVRLSKYPIKAIIVCEPLNDSRLRYTLATLQKKSDTRLTEETIYYWLGKITVQYRIPVIFADLLAVRKVVNNLLNQCKIVLKEL